MQDTQTTFQCPKCRSPLTLLRDDDLDTKPVCRAPGVRRIECSHPRCDFATHYGTTVKDGDERRIDETIAAAAAQYEQQLETAQRGPAIPEDMFTTVPLNGFRTISLNASDMDHIGQTTAAIIKRDIPNPEYFPHLRATVSYLRPTQDIDLWCLPHLAFIGNPPQAEMDRAINALNEGLARSSMMMPAITPAEFFAMVKNQADPGNSPATPGT